MTYIMGVYPGHDSSVCLLRDGEIICLIEEERLTRVKHAVPLKVRDHWGQFNRWGYFPWASITYCLRAANIALDDLDAVVVPKNNIDYRNILPIKDTSKILPMGEPAGGVHHFCHALSAFYASPFDSAAVLVADGDGDVTAEGPETESGFFFANRQGEHRQIFKNRNPILPIDVGPGIFEPHAGLGIMYETLSTILGFTNTRIGMAEPGKTMGLAPYGKPTPELAEKWVQYDKFSLDFSNLLFFLMNSGLINLVSFDTRARALIQDEEHISQWAKDLAFKVQEEVEKALFHLAVELHRATGAKNLCFAGGVALNSVANGIIAARGPFENVFFQPAAADNGQAVGLACYGALQLKSSVKPIRHAFGGRSYSSEEIRSLLDACGVAYEEFRSDEELVKDAAGELVEGRIIGWCQGGSEYGPRALGHRSIVADPRPAGMKDRLNRRVKFRESFRPFAPSVLRERAADVFELRGESPYMLVVAPVRADWAPKIPAITHVDGTARIQTVDVEVDPLYHGLISAFEAKTGVPLVLNTSFNLRGMPVVETPRDALQCFLYTDMDALYVGRFKVKPLSAQSAFPKIARGWQLVGSRRMLHGTEDPGEVFFENRETSQRVQVPPEEADLCSRFDGKQSLQQLLTSGQKGAVSAGRAESALRLVQKLLRSRAVTLQMGTMEI